MLISLIIPCYNGEKTISRAADSVIAQPRFDLVELIIVNDGSKDGSATIIDAYATKHRNIRAIHKENGGVSSARNLGIEHATGKYLAFLDADDWWESGFLDDELAKELTENRFDIYAFSYKNVVTSGKYAKSCRVQPGTDYYTKPERWRYNWFHPCSIIHRREFVISKGIRYLPTKFAEDMPFAEMAFFLADSSKRIDKTIFSYWSNTASVCHTRNPIIVYEESIKSFEYAREWFTSYGAEYNIDYSIIMTFSDIITDICVQNSYRDSVIIANELKHIDIVHKYKDYQLSPKLYKTINTWETHSFAFWLKSQLFVRPIHAIKRLLQSYPHLRAFPDWLYYRVIKKYEKTGMQT